MPDQIQMTEPTTHDPAGSPSTQGIAIRRGSSRERRALVGVTLLVVLTVAGLLVSRAVKSPAQRAAETAAPPKTVITAAVERRVLVSTLIERGTVVANREVVVTPPPESNLAAVQILTSINASNGQQIHDGHVVLSISGRPLIALTGDLPPYRDLSVGSVGPDVVQLQRALGLVADGVGSDPSGTYGTGTAAAVARLYSSAGYPPIMVGGQATLPMAEVVYLSAFPAVVTQLTASVGDVVKAPLITFTTGALRVDVDVDPSLASLITTGMRVDLVAEALDEEATGTVSVIGALTTTPPASTDGAPADPNAPTGPFVPVQVTPTKPLNTQWLGQDVRATLTSARTSGPVLVVPSSALSTAADGSTSVVVSTSNTGQRVVRVHAGASGDGYVEVDPISGTLAPGDLVVVGQ